MQEVILNGFGVGDIKYEINHAQRILNLQKNNPPSVWKLNDPLFKLDKGQIVLIQKENVIPQENQVIPDGENQS